MPASPDQEVLLAIERLHLRHKLLSLDEARLAARLITGEEVAFPLPRPEPAKAPPAKPAPTGDASADETAAPQADAPEPAEDAGPSS